MPDVEGVVFKVFERESNYDGGSSLWSFKFDGQEGFYRTGEDRHEGVLEAHNRVKVRFDTDNNGNNQVQRVKLLEEDVAFAEFKGKSGGGRKSGGSAPRRTSGGGGTKDGYWEAKSKREAEIVEPRISYTAARKHAMEWIAFLVSSENVKLPAKTKLAERQAALDVLLDIYTSAFYADATGESFGAIERAAHETDAPTKVEAEAGDDDEWPDEQTGGDDDDF